MISFDLMIVLDTVCTVKHRCLNVSLSDERSLRPTKLWNREENAKILMVNLQGWRNEMQYKNIFGPRRIVVV